MGAVTAGILAGGALLGAGAQAYTGAKAAKAQENASKSALDLQRQQLAANRRDVSFGRSNAAQYLTDAYDSAIPLLRQGGIDARGNLEAGFSDAQGYLQGTQDSRLAGMLDAGLYSDFEQSPGFAFRQQQGEQAINRSAAAQGGRLGSSTLQRLAEFNSGLASQEFDNFAQRRAQEAGLAQNVDARDLAIAAQQAGLAQGRGSSLANLDLGNAQNIANAQLGRGSAMANLYMNSAGLLSGQGAAALPMYQAPTQYAGQGTAAIGNAFQSGLGNLSQLGLLYQMGAFDKAQ